jgi:hypothetical protein
MLYFFIVILVAFGVIYPHKMLHVFIVILTASVVRYPCKVIHASWHNTRNFNRGMSCHIQMTPVVYRQAYGQQDTLKTVSNKFESKLSNFDWRVR